MWYYLTWTLSRLYSTVYFKKIYFTGLDQLPRDKPLILACNHPTAFIDPVIVGSGSSHVMYFILRGDMFGKGKLAAYILKSVKCVPIYRFRDGFAAMKKNEEILQYCYDLLGDGNNIFILAEGTSKEEKRMRPIQKGTARMAFGAYEKHQRADITVIPVGMNYTNPREFRSSVYTDFGTPIPIADFLEDHTKNPKRAIKRLTDKLSQEMRKRIIHIADEADDELGNQLLKIEENSVREKVFPRLTYQPSRQFQMWAKIERLNALSEEAKIILKQKSTTYFDQLATLGLKDIGVAQSHIANPLVTLALLIGLPAFLVGIIGNFLPIRFGKYLAEKMANTIEFNSALRFAFEMLSYFFYFILLLALAITIGNGWYILSVALLPLFGQFSLHWLDFFKVWCGGLKFKFLSKNKRDELLKKRGELASF